MMTGEKVTIYKDKLVFKSSGKIFTLRVDVLKVITEHKLNTTHSPDPKNIIVFIDEMRVDIHSRGKSLRDRNLTKTILTKEHFLHLGENIRRNHFPFRKS